MDRKEKILGYIRSSEYIPLKLSELMIVLDVPEKDRSELEKILSELTANGKIIITKRGRYISAPKDVISGIVRCSEKNKLMFVSPEDGQEDIFIPERERMSALNGDTVLVKCEKKHCKNHSREGRITKIVSRANLTIIGEVLAQKNGFYRIVPDDLKIYSFPRVRPSDMMNAVVGDRVSVSVTNIDAKGKITAVVSENFGKADDLKSLVNSIISENKIKKEFDPQTLDEAEKLGKRPKKDDLIGRLDLREKMIFTIDGADAKDFDDAVGIERTANGWRLGVHIADVTNYVKPNTALDHEANLRATSVYLPDRVIPMLPEALSNGLCSLKPNTERLTLSVIMEVDKCGNVENHTLTESVIRSKYRLTYDEVNAFFDGDKKTERKFAKISDDLFEMKILAELLNKKRMDRGAINLDFPEASIETDKMGEPVDISLYERGISNRMIEEFMLLANETVAEYAFWAELPFVYRIHEAPSFEKITAFKLYASSLGYTLKGKLDKSEGIHPKALETILESASGRPEERAIARQLLQSLMKATYSPENLGHFGLAAKYYCHFTSPIRRYPDLAIHRILKSFLQGELDEKTSAEFTEFAKFAAKHSTDMEIAAQTVERDTDDLMKAYYMADFIGEEFEGIVSGVTSFGMFVELPNTVEGLIRLQSMHNDFYIYDESTMTLTGERHGKTYKIGDRVKIVLAGCDVISRKIDFSLLVTEDEENG